MNASQPPAIMLTPSLLPSEETTYFLDSSFFTKHKSLPTPTEVRAVAAAAVLVHPVDVVKFPSLDLLVKHGCSITIDEGRCLWALRRFLPDVPVPEVYGWCRDGGEVFIYMQLVEGVTLAERWEGLSVAERLEVCKQLRRMLASLRFLRQDPKDEFIGSIGRQPLCDIIFISSCSPPAGPFLDVQAFHDYYMSPKRLYDRTTNKTLDQCRDMLVDDVPIVFTHGDIHRGNIIVSAHGDPQVVAIVDWHQSGWYPQHWEFCKALWCAKIGSDWAKDVEIILDKFDGYPAFDWFALSLGV